MFEKESEEYADKNATRGGSSSFGDITNYHDLREGFKDGAEFGYNKANEWHDLRKDPNDLPKCNNTDLLLYIESKKFKNNFYSLFYRSEQPPKGEQMKRFMITCNVIAWKEIVLPELKESE